MFLHCMQGIVIYSEALHKPNRKTLFKHFLQVPISIGYFPYPNTHIFIKKGNTIYNPTISMAVGEHLCGYLLLYVLYFYYYIMLFYTSERLF